MKLFRFEIKKLLLNKKSLLLMAVLCAVYVALGFFFTLGNSWTDESQANEYFALTNEHAGVFNEEQLAASKAFVEAAISEYGDGDPFYHRVSADPVLRFHYEYVEYGGRVDAYWNGPTQQDTGNILGVYPIQAKLAGLEQNGQVDTYEHQYYETRLNTELKFGEPVFSRVTFWDNYLLAFEGMFIFFLLMMVIVYFIAPLFTQEVKTDMDSIVLCSLRGRREIVTAKLLSAALTSGVIAVLYVISFALGLFVGIRDLSGADAPVRCLAPLQFASLDMTIGGAALFSVLWLVFASVVLGIALAFLSTRAKNQSAAMGLGIVILVLSISTGMFPQSLRQIAWPAVDFNFAALAAFVNIFGGTKAYNFFGQPLTYAAAAFAAGVLITLIACALTYIAQRKRSAA